MTTQLFNYKIGLVLSGGGGRGAYQVGFYQGLWELELHRAVKAISGTSIGALNGALFAMNNRYLLGEIWEKASYARLFEGEEKKHNRFLSLAKRYHEQRHSQKLPDFLRESEVSVFSQAGIARIIGENFDAQTINESGKEIFACAYHIDGGYPTYFRLNGEKPERLKEILLASSALPLLFRPVCIDGVYYSDGGVTSPFSPHGHCDKIPVAPLAGMDLDLIIVVYLRHEDKAEFQGLVNCPVLEIYPHEPLEKIHNTGALDLSTASIKRRIDLGYRDAMSILSPILVGLMHGKNLNEYILRHNVRNKELRKAFKAR